MGDLFHPAVEFFNVAGVDAHSSAAGVNGGKNVFWLEVNVGDHRDGGFFGDGWQRIGVDRLGAGDTYNIAAAGGELCDLLQGGVDIMGFGGGHGLDRHRIVGANTYAAHHELAGFTPWGQNRHFFRLCGKSEADRGRHENAPW